MPTPDIWLRGRTEARLTGALPEGFFNRCAASGIAFWSARQEGPFALRLTLRSRDVPRAQSIAARCGCTLELGERAGPPLWLGRAKRRLFLCAGALLLALALLWSSLYVWEIEVAENDSALPAGKILRVLDEQGVGVGSFWPSFSSDLIRSRALAALPELCWLTVNVRGSRASVIARAAVPVPEIRDDTTPCDVTAAQSGIVRRLTVLEGEPRVKPGDAVTEGQVLVSAQRGGTLSPERLVHARAEVQASVWYELTACAPLSEQVRTYTGAVRRRWALSLGQRRINFYADSGNLPSGCDRIVRMERLGIDGVFVLPLTLVTETLRRYTLTERQRDPEALGRELETALSAQLTETLGDGGEIAATHYTKSVSRGVLYVTLRAECLQRIDTETPRPEQTKPAEELAWTGP